MKFSFLIAFLWASLALAAIPKASMILQRTADNAGKGLYQIDQEVQFPNGADTLILRESWLVLNENSMKLVVTGAKELKGQVSFSIQINNGSRSGWGGNRKVTEDFIERYFHFRSAEAWAQALQQMKLVPANVLAKPTGKTSKDFEYQPENFVHLGRSGGIVAYVFGGRPIRETEPPGFWIEQDVFVLRKFRLPSLVEETAEKFAPYAHGLMFPHTRTVRWDTNQVTIQTLSVSAKPKSAWAHFGANVPTKTEVLNNSPIVQEFYKRFR